MKSTRGERYTERERPQKREKQKDMEIEGLSRNGKRSLLTFL